MNSRKTAHTPAVPPIDSIDPFKFCLRGGGNSRSLFAMHRTLRMLFVSVYLPQLLLLKVLQVLCCCSCRLRPVAMSRYTPADRYTPPVHLDGRGRYGDVRATPQLLAQPTPQLMDDIDNSASVGGAARRLEASRRGGAGKRAGVKSTQRRPRPPPRSTQHRPRPSPASATAAPVGVRPLLGSLVGSSVCRHRTAGIPRGVPMPGSGHGRL